MNTVRLFLVLCRFETLERELSRYKQLGGSTPATAAAGHTIAKSQQQPMLRAMSTSQAEAEAGPQPQQAGAQVVRLSRKELRELSEDELADRLSKSNVSAASLAGLALSSAPGGNASASASAAVAGASKQHPSQNTPATDATSGIAPNASQPLRTAAAPTSLEKPAAVRRQPHPPAMAPGTGNNASVAGAHHTAGAHVLRDAGANEAVASGHKNAQRDRDARVSFGPADSLDPN